MWDRPFYNKTTVLSIFQTEKPPRFRDGLAGDPKLESVELLHVMIMENAIDSHEMIEKYRKIFDNGLNTSTLQYDFIRK